MDMYPPSDHELDSLPHVVLTSDADWDPTMADNEIDSGDVSYDALDTEPPPGTSAYGDTKFDQLGYYRLTASKCSRSDSPRSPQPIPLTM